MKKSMLLHSAHTAFVQTLQPVPSVWRVSSSLVLTYENALCTLRRRDLSKARDMLIETLDIERNRARRVVHLPRVKGCKDRFLVETLTRIVPNVIYHLPEGHVKEIANLNVGEGWRITAIEFFTVSMARIRLTEAGLPKMGETKMWNQLKGLKTITRKLPLVRGNPNRFLHATLTVV